MFPTPVGSAQNDAARKSQKKKIAPRRRRVRRVRRGSLPAPIVGYLLDRYGPKPLMLAAALFAGVGYTLFAFVTNYTTFLIVYLGLISLAFNAGFVHAPTAVANSSFIGTIRGNHESFLYLGRHPRPLRRRRGLRPYAELCSGLCRNHGIVGHLCRNDVAADHTLEKAARRKSTILRGEARHP